MKQRITAEQLAELTEEQKERLREWWLPKRGDLYVFEGYELVQIEYCDRTVEDKPFIGLRDGDNDKTYNKYLPLLSIGQMIELLHTKSISVYGGIVGNKAGVGASPGDYFYEGFDYEAEELTDALWEAVKRTI
jgi:hypothetical protein